MKPFLVLCVLASPLAAHARGGSADAGAGVVIGLVIGVFVLAVSAVVNLATPKRRRRSNPKPIAPVRYNMTSGNRPGSNNITGR